MSEIDYVLTDALKSTRFGVPNSKEPVRITGWYKYQPGEKFTDMDMNVYPDRKDEASIYAVYYRNRDDKGESYVLDGHAVEDLDKLLDNPQVYKVARVASLPATDTWTQWEMFFEGRDAPDDLVAAQGCNLALVFSSSKRGAQKMSGLFTGHVQQKVKQWMLTVPVQATFTLSQKVMLKGGPYVSFLLSKGFNGIASDGYLRKDNPTGPKILMGNREGEWATYEFDDDMRSVQFGIGIGVDWQVYKCLGVSADLNWGLTGIFPSDFKTVEQALYPVYGTIGVFYRLK